MKKLFKTPKHIPGIGEVGKDGKPTGPIFGSTKDIKTDTIRKTSIHTDKIVKKIYGEK